ncbi:placenta-specific gene 8 protein-like isoform X2 [Crassostrea virginica]
MSEMSGPHGPGQGKVGPDPGPMPGQQPVTQQPPAYPAYPAPAPMQMQSNTTVVINQAGPRGRPPPRQWSSGLCGCFSDMDSCLGVFFCGNGCYPCYLSYKLNESCCLPCVLGGGTWLLALRVKMRAENNIEGSILNDFYTSCCCAECVMCQLSREHDFVTSQAMTY